MRAFFIEPSWALCQFFPKLPSCIISVGSQNTMAPMQQPQHLSAVFCSYTWYPAFQICEPWETRSMCCTVLLFSYPNISGSRSSKKALIALGGHQDKEPTAVTLSECLMSCTGGSCWLPAMACPALQATPGLVQCSLWAWLQTDLCLTLLSPPVPGREVTSDPSSALGAWAAPGSGGIPLLWFICMALYSSLEQSLQPCKNQHKPSAQQKDSFRKSIILPLPHKETFLNGTTAREIWMTIPNCNIYLCTWTLQHSVWWNLHRK